MSGFECVDYIPFAELVQCAGSSREAVEREFRKKYELDGALFIKRTKRFKHETMKSSERARIWEQCLLEGKTVSEARKLIREGKAKGSYKNPTKQSDIIIAAYCGAIRLEAIK